MNVITLRDYAKQNNISYEAVRKQVVRYQDELAGHLIKDGRQQFLDEEAVAFLDAKRQKNPVAIIQMDKDEKIDQLENENKGLLQELAIVQKALLAEKDKTDMLLAEQKGRIDLLEADNEAAKAKIAEADRKAQEAQQALSGAHEAFEKDLAKKDGEIQKKDEQIKAWEKYYAAKKTYDAMTKWQRWRQKVQEPVPPVPANVFEE